MGQITGPVIATTLVLLAVFLPVTLMPGITGRLYSQFAVTISVAVVISSVNALTLSPALCAMILRPRKGPPGGLLAVFEGGIDRTRKGYTGIVRRLVVAPTQRCAREVGRFYRIGNPVGQIEDRRGAGVAVLLRNFDHRGNSGAARAPAQPTRPDHV